MSSKPGGRVRSGLVMATVVAWLAGGDLYVVLDWVVVDTVKSDVEDELSKWLVRSREILVQPALWSMPTCEASYAGPIVRRESYCIRSLTSLQAPT